MSDDPSFNLQVLRVFTALYRAHPRMIEISSEQTHIPAPERKDHDYEDKMSSSGGTLTWLDRNGFVSGDYERMGIGAFIINAQLTSTGYRIFREIDSNVGGQIAQAALTAADAGDDRSLAIIADRLVERLT